jgi:hypothetical protein
MAKSKPRPEEDPEREERITMEIVVDAYNEVERVIGWYCYLQEHLHFPFTAKCILKRATSPLKVNDEVKVIGMAPEEECERDMFVMIRWQKDGLGVPLAQLQPMKADEETEQAVADWHYWVQMGYQF